MRYVFIDEAGTAANEPVSVVVGIIIHADKQCAAAEAAVNDVLSLIPDQHQEACSVFHAKAIWGDPKLRENWDLTERKKLLTAMMSLPRNLQLNLAIGACYRTTELPAELLQQRRISLAQAHHGIAFQECIVRADKWINQYARHNEVATVIAEDLPEGKSFLRRLARHLRDTGYAIPKEDVRLVEHGRGHLLSVDEFRQRKISRIRLPIYFVEKQDEALLQIADACAFGFRRFLGKQSHGADFAAAIIGGPQDVEKYPIATWGGGIFSWSHGPKFSVSYCSGNWQGRSS